MESFWVGISRWGKPFKVTVTITYNSTSITRMKISGGTRWMLAERHNYRKTNRWKFRERNFNFKSKNPKHDAAVLRDILTGIELYLYPGKGKSRNTKAG